MPEGAPRGPMTARDAYEQPTLVGGLGAGPWTLVSCPPGGTTNSGPQRGPGVQEKPQRLNEVGPGIGGPSRGDQVVGLGAQDYRVCFCPPSPSRNPNAAEVRRAPESKVAMRGAGAPKARAWGAGPKEGGEGGGPPPPPCTGTRRSRAARRASTPRSRARRRPTASRWSCWGPVSGDPGPLPGRPGPRTARRRGSAAAPLRDPTHLGARPSRAPARGSTSPSSTPG